MKITSINFIDSSTIPVKSRNTKTNANVIAILDNLQKAPAGKSLLVAGDDLKKFERYQLQKALQKAGAHVLVTSGIHPQTNKPCLFVKRLTEAEWKEWMKS